MTFSANNIYHIYNQGNNRQTIFFKREDYLMFLNLNKKLIHPNVATIAWCLMPNHFHFMVHTDERCNTKIKQGGIFIYPITNGIRKLLSGYARIFNNQNQRSGSVFRQKTKSKCLSDIKITSDSSYLQ
jgi:putative transposase